ncbi:MAG: hypothetical protein HN413_07920, partial [Chloroflexi bacterium]|nr:hypothetical protein [Chloroflexota bacterium]
RYRADNAFIEIENTQEASYKWMDARGNHGDNWRPSIFMPRWACRIILDIVYVRVERVQEISEDDAIAEGCTGEHFDLAVNDFIWLWDSINAKRGFSWESNPWVWVVEFKVAPTATLTNIVADAGDSHGYMPSE